MNETESTDRAELKREEVAHILISLHQVVEYLTVSWIDTFLPHATEDDRKFAEQSVRMAFSDFQQHEGAIWSVPDNTCGIDAVKKHHKARIRWWIVKRLFKDY